MKRFLCLLLASIIVAGCATTDLDVADSDISDIDFIHEVHPRFDLGNYGSYDWVASTNLIYDPQGKWEPPEFDLDDEIRFLIDTELRSHGLIQSSNGPDLLASFNIAIQMDEMPFNRDTDEEMPVIENVQQGALVITLTDPDLDYPVWVGLAAADISATPEVELARKRLSYVVSNLLLSLPDN